MEKTIADYPKVAYPYLQQGVTEPSSQATHDNVLQGKRHLYDQIAADLNVRGLVDGDSFLHAMMTPHGMVAKRTTLVADACLAFTADPLS